jgi:ATP-dependent Lhr-like helicase
VPAHSRQACAEPFRADDLYAEITASAPYARLPRETFDRAIQFVAHGGYALQSYERYARIKLTKDGTWRVAHPSVAQQYRLNCGTIIEAPMLNIRLTRQRKGGPLRGGPVLGKIEEGFIEALVPGDTFLFAGKVLLLRGHPRERLHRLQGQRPQRQGAGLCGRQVPDDDLSVRTGAQDAVRPGGWDRLPHQVSDWLKIQKAKSVVPGPKELLVETFPRGNRFYLVAYPFEGRLAHQTLCMLLTRRLERAKARPLGFVASDYAVAIWGLRDMGAMLRRGELTLSGLFDQDMLGDDLEAWLDESYLLKRTFRACATIAGLIEKRHPGKEKVGPADDRLGGPDI